MTLEAPKTRKVKKKKLKVKAFIVFVCIIFLIVMTLYYLYDMPARNINVESNDYLSVSKVLKEMNLTDDAPYLRTTSRACKKLSSPLIKTCHVKHHLDLTISIVIEENKPLFYYTKEKRLALSNGELLDLENTYGVPTLINYVPTKTLNKFIDGLKDIKSDIIRSISEIEYSPSTNGEGDYIDAGRFMLSMNDGNTIYINIKHIDVLNSYEKVYSSVKDKKGTYYFDCDYNNYYFEEYK